MSAGRRLNNSSPDAAALVATVTSPPEIVVLKEWLEPECDSQRYIDDDSREDDREWNI
jgi:hypothetical protein